MTEHLSASEHAGVVEDRVPILVVDDRKDNLLAVEAVLEPLHLEVIRAMSGAEALRHLLTEDVAVILLDVQMPDLDGFETAQIIKSRARTKNIPIIFLTALSREIEHQLRGYDAGAVDYLAKPFEPQVLRSKVMAFVNLFRQARIIERQREELAQRLVERDRAEAALRIQTVELERSNAELERFAFVASHELREPLQVVAGFLDLLRAHVGEAQDETALLVDRADAGIQRMVSLIDELLAYARASSGEQHMTTLSLDEVFHDTRERMAADIETTGATITSDPLPSVHGDRWQLSRVFANLLDNAIRFRGDRDPLVHVGVSSRDGVVVISVRDNGCGIDPDAIPTLFTIAGSVHSGLHGPGLGVGLPLCRRVIERHGGEIWIESVVGRGTTVSFTLPAHE